MAGAALPGPGPGSLRDPVHGEQPDHATGFSVCSTPLPGSPPPIPLPRRSLSPGGCIRPPVRRDQRRLRSGCQDHLEREHPVHRLALERQAGHHDARREPAHQRPHPRRPVHPRVLERRGPRHACGGDAPADRAARIGYLALQAARQQVFPPMPRWWSTSSSSRSAERDLDQGYERARVQRMNRPRQAPAASSTNATGMPITTERPGPMLRASSAEHCQTIRARLIAQIRRPTRTRRAVQLDVGITVIRNA